MCAEDDLSAGYRRFRRTLWPREQERFTRLAREGQTPHTVVVACSDSRVPPEFIFDAHPGDLFVVRNVANLVPPYAPDTANHGTSAALEFAVRVLGVRRIAVMGHSGCGGIAALMQGAPEEARDFVEPWVRIAEPARLRARLVHPFDAEAARHFCELESIRVSLANLMGFPWIAEAVSRRALSLEGYHFDVGSGTLRRVLPEGTAPLAAEEA